MERAVIIAKSLLNHANPENGGMTKKKSLFFAVLFQETCFSHFLSYSGTNLGVSKIAIWQSAICAIILYKATHGLRLWIGL